MDTPLIPPVVTVVLTVYQRTTYLREALESALAQTFPALEILVTDDSDSAPIRAICEAYRGTGKVRYRANVGRLGVALNVRAAIAEAGGRYIALLNDDDRWEPRFLERLVAALDADPRRVVAFCDHWIIREDGQVDLPATEENTRRYSRHTLPEGEVVDAAELILERNSVPMAMGAMFRKEALPLEQLVSEVTGAYDYWMSCLLAATGRPFCYVAERLTCYRVHPAMETARRAVDKSLNLVFIYRSLLERNCFPRLRARLARLLSGALLQCGKESLYFNQCARARSYFLESLRWSPTPKAMAAVLLSFTPRPVRVGWGLTVRDEA